MVRINVLKEFGLTDNEARVYLASLELGISTVQDLGKKSQVKRTTVYTTMEGLKQKGLISQTKKGKKTFFVAESPERLMQLSERRHEQLKKSLPELKSIYNVEGTKPNLRFLEGREGYLSVYENILKEKPDEFLALASYEHFLQHLDLEYEKQWTEQRISKGIKLRWLDFKSDRIAKHAAEGKKSLRKVRYLPDNFPFTSTMFLYNDKVTIVSGKQKEFIAVVIEHAEFCHTFKQIFEMIWSISKPAMKGY